MKRIMALGAGLVALVAGCAAPKAVQTSNNKVIYRLSQEVYEAADYVVQNSRAKSIAEICADYDLNRDGTLSPSETDALNQTAEIYREIKTIHRRIQQRKDEHRLRSSRPRITGSPENKDRSCLTL